MKDKAENKLEEHKDFCPKVRGSESEFLIPF